MSLATEFCFICFQLIMFSLTSMPSTATTSVLSAYITFAAFAMLVRTLINEFKTITSQLFSQKLQENFLSRLEGLFGNFSSQMTLIIDEYNGLSINEIYQASEVYLTTRITPSTRQFKVFKTPREENLSITVNTGEKIVDIFEGIHFTWEFVSTKKQKSYYDSERDSQATETTESRSILLSFSKKYKENVLNTYLPHVVGKSKAIQEEKKVLRLYSVLGRNLTWESVHLEHPSTFNTIAMDPKQKKELMDDLDRFVKRRDYYRRVGKAWKRGYLLYGPPGTGKSSLIAAMANYLKFDVYDLELTNLHSNSELRRLLVSVANRSILVIEDIDFIVELHDRYQYGGYDDADSQLTLSGLLNFIDGLWSSCGDERILVFKTNHKDRIITPAHDDVPEEQLDSESDDEPEEHLDPALLGPGRIDMHIHMSYCTPCGFKILASNYLRIESHDMFAEIEGLLKQVEVTPAQVAEELMKSDVADIALTGLVAFLQRLNGLI